MKLECNWWWLDGGSTPAAGDTTADGKQVFLIIGDSNADGRGTSIPTVAADTLFLYNGTDLTEITTQTVANNGSYGSPWQQFATNYKSLSSKKTVLVQAGWGGSEFYPNGDNTNWYTSGDLYQPAVDDANACLTYLSLQKLKGIIVCLGINDARGSQTTANIESAIDSLVTRLKADFPDTPIVFEQQGRDETASITARIATVRKKIKNVCLADADCHLMGGLLAMSATGNYDADNLHTNQTGNNYRGDMLSRYFFYDTYSKWAREIISSHFDDISTTRKNLIEDLITAIDYSEVDNLYNFKTTIEQNVYFDWGFLTGHLEVGTLSFTANSYISPVSPNYINTAMNPSSLSNKMTIDDGLMGAKVKTNRIAAGTSAALFGISTANPHRLRVVQTSSSDIAYQFNDNTASTYSDTKLQNDSFYASYRNSGTKGLIKNGVSVASESVATTGIVNLSVYVGSHNNSGTASLTINADLEYFISSKFSTFDYLTFYNEMEALITGW